MQQEEIKTIVVCGAGTMGAGIAQVAAQAGYHVLLYDVKAEALQRAKEEVVTALQKFSAKAGWAATEVQQVLSRLRYTQQIDECVGDLCIEAIIEQHKPKIELLQKLYAANRGNCILASNTSSISITSLQHHIVEPQLVAGMHFFNPATHMKLVEIISGTHTAPWVIEQLNEVAIRMQKHPVQCIDSPGFIVNRVARPYYLEALRLLEEGVATVEQIDEVMEATGFRLGPFKLMDLIGIDINYNTSVMVYDAMHKPARLEPSALQKEKVEQQKLGRKTGEGFYRY